MRTDTTRCREQKHHKGLCKLLQPIGERSEVMKLNIHQSSKQTEMIMNKRNSLSTLFGLRTFGVFELS
jgi:hypothetical protein